MQLTFITPNDAIHSLFDPRIRKASKKFNLDFIRKGGNMYASSHCFQLVDWAVASPIPRWTDEEGHFLDLHTGRRTEEKAPDEITYFELATGKKPPPPSQDDQGSTDGAS